MTTEIKLPRPPSAYASIDTVFHGNRAIVVGVVDHKTVPFRAIAPTDTLLVTENITEAWKTCYELRRLVKAARSLKS